MAPGGCSCHEKIRLTDTLWCSFTPILRRAEVDLHFVSGDCLSLERTLFYSPTSDHASRTAFCSRLLMP
jgi:hypothetical protein